MPAPESIWDGFTSAHVWLTIDATHVVLAPAQMGTVDPFPFAQPVHIVTAYNPMGELATDDVNTAAHESLVAALRGHRVLASMGCDAAGKHREHGLAILDIGLEMALDLGRQFRQLAIYQWTATERSVISCVDATAHPTGWTLRPRSSPHS